LEGLLSVGKKVAEIETGMLLLKLPRFSASSAGWRKATGSAPNLNLLTADQSPEGQARAYRLLRWLGQHRPQHPHYAQHLQHPHRPLHPHHGPQPVPVHRPGPRLYAAPVSTVLIQTILRD